jgi:hypothetical protein
MTILDRIILGVAMIPSYHQSLMDKVTPFTLYRWIGTVILLIIYFLRVFIARGWAIVTYTLGIYALNLFLGFLAPKVDPALDTTIESDDEGTPALPVSNNEEFRPFVRKVPEFKFWLYLTRGILIAIFCSLFRVHIFIPFYYRHSMFRCFGRYY